MAKLGQHFLIRKDVPQKIVAALELEKGDSVIEIGPGHGELSVPLTRRLSLLEGSLVLIEKDADLVKLLTARKEF